MFAEQRPEHAVCGWAVLRSEIKGERQPKASAEDIRAVEQPKRSRRAQARLVRV